MTAIRFLITWSAIEPSPGTFDDAYLDWVRERMSWAHDAGLTVILDMHQDVYGEGFGFDGAPSWACDAANYAGFTPQQPWGINYANTHVMACFDALWSDPSELVATWQHVAEYLADEPAIIGFDPINEPSWGSYPIASFEKDRLQPFYEQVIPAVRKAAPKWLAFVEPSSSRSLGFATSLQPFHDSGIVYSPHLYDVNAEQSGHFDPSHVQQLIDSVADFQSEADRLHAALWIGEYGGMATDPDIGVYLGADYDAEAAVAAGSTYWAYDKSGGYSPLDPQGNEVPAIVSAVVVPAPAKIAGTPIDWSYDPTSKIFALDYQPAGSQPTVIMVPPRLYPNGVNVDCGGCEFDLSGSELTVRADTGRTARTPETITISPL